ncbi:F0F1 ATP synthase subunit A [Acidimangrovimonas pyrenivorans]|uniref:ATP synthase subunit a n=1 Tax=Acidimangrovimonas pyrenivorans TaxID=2030798 RepID=A0ABV7ABP3_9RHOB
MHHTPFGLEILFHLGPVPISRAVVTTWGIMALLTLVSWWGTRAAARGGLFAAALEILVETLEEQVRSILQRDPWPYLPMLGTLFVFLVVANLSAVVPGVTPPTGRIETPAALALIVFFSIHYFGIKARGAGGYFAHFLHPSPMLLPLNILGEFTRILSLMVRLFGNMMSHEFVIAIVLYLAGLFLPVPFMLLGILIGVIQAYIFTILATVYIGAGIGAVET